MGYLIFGIVIIILIYINDKKVKSKQAKSDEPFLRYELIELN